jgi:hypothetical protein
MSLNDLKVEFGPEISSMAEDLSNSLPMSKPQIRDTFTDKQIEDLHKLIDEVNKETERENKIVKLEKNAAAAFNLLIKLGVAL